MNENQEPTMVTLTPIQINSNLTNAASAYLSIDYSDSTKAFREEHDSLIIKVNHRNWRAIRSCNNAYTVVKLVCTFLQRIKSTIFNSDEQIQALLDELKDFV